MSKELEILAITKALLLLEDVKVKKIEENSVKEVVKQKFKDKEKTKVLTDKERLDRLEELLGLK